MITPTQRSLSILLSPLFLFAMTWGLTGCGRPAATDGDEAAASPSAGQDAAPRAEAPRLDIAESAPTLDAAHPGLASGVLQSARLMALPDGLVLVAGDIVFRADDVARYIEQAPPRMQDELHQFALFILEQMVTEKLLAREAQRVASAKGWDTAQWSQQILLQRYVESLADDVQVSDADLRAFYDENRQMIGGMPFDTVKNQIADVVRQQKQQAIVEATIANIGRQQAVALDADWANQQAARARENPVDQARASGKPTLASFGADSCMPCRIMIPAREELARKYEGRINVVYVRVDQHQLLGSRYGVRGIPHLIFFDADGREVKTHTGVLTLEQMEEPFARMGVGEE